MSPNKKTKKTTRSRRKALEIELRRQKVADYRVQGFTIEQIAKEMKVDPRTIKRDIAAIRDGMAESLEKQIKQFDHKLYWADRVATVKWMIQKLKVALSEQKSDRSQVAKAIDDLLDSLDKNLRAAGIKTTTVNPDSLAIDTIKIIHEYPKQD